jgi:hypothetical protein
MEVNAIGSSRNGCGGQTGRSFLPKLCLSLVALGLAPAGPGQADERQLETLVLNGGRLFEGTIVDANRNTVAIRTQSGVAEIVRADDIQTVYIPADDPEDAPFFGSFVGWQDGVYELNVNFQLVQVKDGVMQGRPVAVAASRPQPQAVAKATPVATAPSSARDRAEEGLPPAVDAAATAAPSPARTAAPAGSEPALLAAAASDAPLPSLEVEVDSGAVEGDALITYHFRLSEPVEQSLFIAYRTLDGSAEAERDYRTERDVLVIPAGSQTAELKVPLIDDDVAEPAEAFTLIIATSSGSVALDRTRIETVITDDD